MRAQVTEALITASAIITRITHGHTPFFAIRESDAHAVLGTTALKAILNGAVATGLTQITCDGSATINICGACISNLGSTSNGSGQSQNKGYQADSNTH